MAGITPLHWVIGCIHAAVGRNLVKVSSWGNPHAWGGFTVEREAAASRED